jgi:hypothetical protein
MPGCRASARSNSFFPRLGLPTPIPDTRKETLSAPLLRVMEKPTIANYSIHHRKRLSKTTINQSID